MMAGNRTVSLSPERLACGRHAPGNPAAPMTGERGTHMRMSSSAGPRTPMLSGDQAPAFQLSQETLRCLARRNATNRQKHAVRIEGLYDQVHLV